MTAYEVRVEESIRVDSGGNRCAIHFLILRGKLMKKHKVALDIGLQTSLFIACPVCQVVTEAIDRSAVKPATEALINDLYQERDPKVSHFEDGIMEVLEIITEVGKGLPYRCTCHPN